MLSALIPFPKEVLPYQHEAYNTLIWPAQLLLLVGSLFALYRLGRSSEKPGSAKIALSVCILGWLLSGFIYHGHILTQLTWAARYVAAVFILQSLLLTGLLLTLKKPEVHPGKRRIAGLLLVAIAVFIPLQYPYPESINQILLLGWGANATAVATIGTLLHYRLTRWQTLLLLIPILWLLTISTVYLKL